MMYKRKIPIELNCGLDLVREVLYGKWKIHLIYFISQGIKRPGDLERKIPGVTRRVLHVQLNQLEGHGLISKKIYAELPPKVEYTLTEFGETLLPVIEALGKWGDDHQEHLRRVIAQSQANSGMFSNREKNNV
ncbi:MAG: winged helix-turn-helix transcriptional regulator [Nodularia sp. CChRGM 3473]